MVHKESVKHALFVLGGYTLFFLIFFSPILFSHYVLAPGDGISYFLPNFYSRTLLWDQSTWAGFPAVGDAQRMFWYPPAVVFSLILRSWDLFVISAFVLAASFTYGYVFSLTRSRLAGAVSGLIYALSGFMIAHMGHAAVIHTIAWLPLIVWAYRELSLHLVFSRIWFALATIAIACAALAGHPQMFTYVVLVSGSWAVVQGLTSAMPSLRYYLTCAATLIIGIALAAVQLVPTSELAPNTLRAALSFQEFVAYQLPLRQLPVIVFPFLYGGAPASFYATPYFGAWPSSADGWGASELTGYVGLLPLVLAGLGWAVNRRNRVAWFWTIVALVALMLVVGQSTPLAWLTYRLPVLNKFRAPARYFFAFGFAISVLAGFGAASVLNGGATKRLVRRVGFIATVIMMVCYFAVDLFSGKLNELAIQRLGQGIPLSPIRNPSILIPVVLFLVGVLVLVLWQSWRTSRLRIAIFLVVLLIDLASFGWFYEWRYRSPYTAYLRAPAAAETYRKQVEENHQRVLPTRGGLGRVSELPPDLSKLWNISSASGYGPFVLTRLNHLVGMQPHGAIDESWREPANQSLDMLSVRYLLLPQIEPDVPLKVDERGLRWSTRDFTNTIGPGCAATTPSSAEIELPQPRRATRIGIVGTLACSVTVPTGVEFAQVTLTNTSGQTQALSLRAGEHFSEWAWDCSDVNASIQHKRAVVFDSRPAERGAVRCESHDYVALLPLGAAQEIKSISLNWTGPPATFVLRKITMIDDERRVSMPVVPAGTLVSDTAHWRFAGKIDHNSSGYGPTVRGEDVGVSQVYENTRARPRTWLVPEVRQVTEAEALNAVRTSRLPDGQNFDLARVALIEEPAPQVSGGGMDPNATSRVRSLTNNVMEVETTSNVAAILVTSDTYYPGWHATIDGAPTRIYQTNYLLRGVAVPSGTHVVRFEFQPRTFYVGAGISVVSLLLLIGACLRRSAQDVPSPSR